MPGPSAVLFDFDLTLVESTGAVAACANYALREMGLPGVTADRVRQTIGLPLAHTLEALTGIADPGLQRVYLDHYRVRADAIMTEMVEFLPGAQDALRAVRRQGLQTAIVSSRVRHRIESILERGGVRWAIDAVIGIEDVANPKPHPEGIQNALRALGVPARHAVYVGDHLVDAQAAAAAGVRFVGVLSGTTPRDAWARHQPAAVIATVADLPGWLVVSG